MARSVKIRGHNLAIVSGTSLSHLGSRWFGQTRWTLRDVETGEMFAASGKRLAHNSRLTSIPGDS